MHILIALCSTMFVIHSVYAFNQEPVIHRPLVLDDTVHEIIDSLSEEDKKSIELFFATCVNQDQFGYALISEKPMALGGGFVKAPYQNILYGYNHGFLFWRGWELWKKHFGKLKFPEFLFIEENYAALPNIRFVFLINKLLFIKMVRVHFERCRALTGRDLDPIKLLEDLEAGVITLQQAIGFNEEILGILLGFGQHNAALYARRQQIIGPLLIPLALDQKPSEGYSSVEEEVAQIWNQLNVSLDEVIEPYMIDPVMFAADVSDVETVALHRMYRNARARLSKLYIDHSYLEVSLRLLLAP